MTTATPAAGTSGSVQQHGLAGSAASDSRHGASPIGVDRLIRAETALGLIREIVPPQDHMGLSIAPFYDVPTDEAIFGYMNGSSTGLAPAIAEDSTSETFQQDEGFAGEGRVNLIDWRLRSSYTASQINHYRELKSVADSLKVSGNLPLTISSPLNQFQDKLARDRVERRRRLDNRIESLIMGSLDKGKAEYNDGKIKYEVDWQRPADQHDQAPASGSYATTEHDPINDALKVIEFMDDEYAITPKRMIAHPKFFNTFFRSSKFMASAGFKPSDGMTQADLPYVWEGFGPGAALEIFKRITGIEPVPYSTAYRTLTPFDKGAQMQKVPFLDPNTVIFLPDEADIAGYDDSPLGFAKTLTSPHPMGNWSTGFYEFEYGGTDPWNHTVGDGIKCFPVFPHMELTYTWKVEY